MQPRLRRELVLGSFERGRLELSNECNASFELIELAEIRTVVISKTNPLLFGFMQNQLYNDNMTNIKGLEDI